MAKLNPEHLQTFAVVAETGNLTRAGLLLDLGQSAISSQMKHLQAAMGAPLYRRSGHGVTLTPAGEALLPYARELARQVNLAQELAEHRQSATPLHVRIGLCLTLGEVLPPLILQACARRLPDVQVDVIVAATPDLAHAVEQGELMLAFAGGIPEPSPSAPHALHVRHVATDRLVWVPPHGVTPREFTLWEAAQHPWLWASSRSTVKTTVETAAQQHGIELPVSRSLGSYVAVRNGVLGGLGGAFFPQHHLLPGAHGDDLRGYTLMDVDLRLPYQSLTAAHQPDAVLQVKQATLSVLDETLRDP